MSEVDIYKGIAKKMSEERLKEIKDSMEIGLAGAKLQSLNYAEGVYEDALELYNEVIRLRERIDKAIEYIKNTPLYETTYDYNMEEELEIQNVSDETASNKLLNILNGRSDE